MGRAPDHGRWHIHSNYPPQVYISYAKSIGLAIERRVMSYPPRRPSDFWRICQQEVDVARWRMRNVSGQVRKAGASETDV